MGDPHNPARYGELWPQHKIDAWVPVLEQLKPFVAFSGGWAWHFMSPVGHPEFKHAHDHKDVDIMVPRANVGTVVGLLKGLGFEKVSTKYDRLPSDEDFRRYEKVVTNLSCATCEGRGNVRPPNPWGARQPECCPDCKGGGRHEPFRLTVDFFVRDVPVMVANGWMVVEPALLLSFYSDIHSSDKAWAVQAAAKLLELGEAPEGLVNNAYLIRCPDLPVYLCTKCAWAGQFPELVGAGDISVCGGCGKYVVRNIGKPLYKTRGQGMAEAVKVMRKFANKGG